MPFRADHRTILLAGAIIAPIMVTSRARFTVHILEAVFLTFPWIDGLNITTRLSESVRNFFSPAREGHPISNRTAPGAIRAASMPFKADGISMGPWLVQRITAAGFS